MSSSMFGILAALASPLVMILGLYIWEQHWKIGSAFALNLFKCCLASCGFLMASFAARSEDFFPKEIFSTSAIGFLFLSSTIGILIGDWAWLEAQQKIGTLRVVLMDTTKPFLAACLAWFILDEQLRWEAFGGMVLTVGGVLIVTLEKDDKTSKMIVVGEGFIPAELNEGHTAGVIVVNEMDAHEVVDQKESTEECDEGTCRGTSRDTSIAGSTPTVSTSNATVRYGYLMAILNVGLDTYGSLLTKEYGVGMTTWEISLLRFGFAGAVMLVVSFSMHVKNLFVKSSTNESCHWYSLPPHSRLTWLFIVAGVALVTFLAPALSNFSLFEIPLALAITLSSIGPLYALPMDWYLKGNTPTIRSVVGCGLAVGGIVLLVVRGTETKR